MPVIDAVIDKDGKVTFSVQGAPGGTCWTYTAGLIAALGLTVESSEPTPEAYEPETVAQATADWEAQS